MAFRLFNSRKTKPRVVGYLQLLKMLYLKISRLSRNINFIKIAKLCKYTNTKSLAFQLLFYPFDTNTGQEFLTCVIIEATSGYNIDYAASITCHLHPSRSYLITSPLKNLFKNINLKNVKKEHADYHEFNINCNSNIYNMKIIIAMNSISNSY